MHSRDRDGWIEIGDWLTARLKININTSLDISRAKSGTCDCKSCVSISTAHAKRHHISVSPPHIPIRTTVAENHTTAPTRIKAYAFVSGASRATG